MDVLEQPPFLRFWRFAVVQSLHIYSGLVWAMRSMVGYYEDVTHCELLTQGSFSHFAVTNERLGGNNGM